MPGAPARAPSASPPWSTAPPTAAAMRCRFRCWSWCRASAAGAYPSSGPGAAGWERAQPASVHMAPPAPIPAQSRRRRHHSATWLPTSSVQRKRERWTTEQQAEQNDRTLEVSELTRLLYTSKWSLVPKDLMSWIVICPMKDAIEAQKGSNTIFVSVWWHVEFHVNSTFW